MVDNLIKVANDIINQLNLNLRISTTEDIDSQVLINIYDAIFKTKTNDKELNKKFSINDVMIIKRMLKNISDNVLHVSLDHIEAEQIVQGNKVALANMLEIFQGLVECMNIKNRNISIGKGGMTPINGNEEENVYKLKLKIRDTNIQTDNLAKMINLKLEQQSGREDYLEKKLKELIHDGYGWRCPSLKEYVEDDEDRAVLIRDQYGHKSKQKVYMHPTHKGISKKSGCTTEPYFGSGRTEQDDDLTKITCQNDQMTEGSVNLSSHGSNETYVVTPRTINEAEDDLEEDSKVKEAWTEVNKDLIHDSYENEFLDMLLRDGDDLGHIKNKVCPNSGGFDKFMSVSRKIKHGIKYGHVANTPRMRKVTPRPCSSGLVKPIVKHINNVSDSEYSVISSSRQTTPRSDLRYDENKDNGGEMVIQLLKEFPGLNINEHSLRKMWAQATKQAGNLQRIQQEFVSRVGPGEQRVEDARRRQQLLFKVLRKEAMQQARLKEMADERESQFNLKAKKEKQRQQSAKVKRYYDEFSQQMRARMVQKQAKEEQVFRETFKAALQLQKERIIDLRKYVKEKKSDDCVRHQKELESLENYYRDRFSMLADCLRGERRKLTLQDKSREKALDHKKREVKKFLEEEIRQLQESMVQSQHEVYFRELDSKEIIAGMCHR